MKTLEILLIIYTFCIVALSIVTYKFYAIRYKYKEKYMDLYNEYEELQKEKRNILVGAYSKILDLKKQNKQLQENIAAKQYPLSALCQKCIKTKKTK